MKLETQQLLEKGMFTIQGDTSLSLADMETIAQALRKHPRQSSLCLQYCNLTYDLVRILLPTLSEHPSLTRVDFSGNCLWNPWDHYEIAAFLVQKNPRINALLLHASFPPSSAEKDHRPFQSKYRPDAHGEAAAQALVDDFHAITKSFAGAYWNAKRRQFQTKVSSRGSVEDAAKKFASLLQDHDTLVLLTSHVLCSKPLLYKETASIAGYPGDGFVRNALVILPDYPNTRYAWDEEFASHKANFQAAQLVTESVKKCHYYVRSPTERVLEFMKEHDKTFFSELSARLPAAIFLARNIYYEDRMEDFEMEDFEDRMEDFLRTLWSIKPLVKAQHDIVIDFEPYLTLKDIETLQKADPSFSLQVAPNPFAVAQTASDLAPGQTSAQEDPKVPDTLRELFAALPDKGLQAWMDEIEKAKGNPVDLLTLGDAIVCAIPQIPQIALRQELTSGIDWTNVARALERFGRFFSHAEEPLLLLAEKKASDTLSPLYSYEYLIGAMQEISNASHILEQELPGVLQKLTFHLAGKIATGQETKQGYVALQKTLGALCQAAQESLTQWRQQDAPERPASQDPTPDVTFLELRYEALKEASLSLPTLTAMNTLGQKVAADELRQASEMRSVVLPLLTQQVSQFASALSTFARNSAAPSASNDGQPPSERCAKATEKNVNDMVQTAESVHGLVGRMKDGLHGPS